jgi:hypothetical protein
MSWRDCESSRALSTSATSESAALKCMHWGSYSEVSLLARHVRCTLNSRRHRTAPACPVRANNRLMHRNKQRSYSITSSARASSVGGTVIPIERAVPRFMASLIRVGS